MVAHGDGGELDGRLVAEGGGGGVRVGEEVAHHEHEALHGQVEETGEDDEPQEAPQVALGPARVVEPGDGRLPPEGAEGAQHHALGPHVLAIFLAQPPTVESPTDKHR